MLRKIMKIAVLLLISAAMISGCAATEQAKSTKRYVWPRPPDEPKIEWIKSYYGENDFPKSGFQEFIEALFGKSEAETFEKPIDIKSNGRGTVFVTDIVIPGIFVFDLKNQKIEVWHKGSDPEKSLALVPYYISLDKNDNLYVVGTGSNDIYVTDSAGRVLRKIDFSKQVQAPGGILVDNDSNRIYLVDASKGSKVVVFDMSGKHLFTIGKPGEGNGEFNRPGPIAMNSKGEILVGDVMNARIQIFDKEGKFLRKFGQRGDTGPDLQIIKGLSVDSDDNIYVTDGKAHQIKIFSSKGDYLLSIGAAYSVTKTFREAPGGFLIPQGIHIDKNDDIFIADQANLRFQHFKYLKSAVTVDPGLKN